MSAKKQLAVWEDPAKEIGELLLDEALEQSAPALAKVPLLSLIVAAVKSGHTWSDYLLARKVQQFYEAWELLPKTERKIIYEKFQSKPKAFVEKLLFILNAQEDQQKCRILGVLSVHYFQGNIARADYYDLIETISQLTMSDIKKLVKLFRYQSLILTEKIVGERYANTFTARGLVETAPRVPGEQRTSRAPMYHLTRLGEQLARAAS